MDLKNQLEHFSLRWNNYNDNMKTGFHDLLRREDFVDVTIAAEGKLIQAHKMVLSICSPYFKNIFKTNPCQHPVVFLKDVTHKELSGILQFMYLGEVSITQEELGRFLKTAEALQVKGLTNEETEYCSPPQDNSDIKPNEQGSSTEVNRYRTRTLPTEAVEGEVKRRKMNSADNSLTPVHAHVPVIRIPEKAVEHHNNESSQMLVKNESSEAGPLNLVPVRPFIGQENNGSGNSGMEEHKTEITDSTHVTNPEAAIATLGNGSGTIHHDLSSIQGTSTEPYKSIEGQQGTDKPTILSKNQGLCPICGRILQHKKNLQTHVLDQHSGIFGCWPCQICNRVCRTWSALRVHTNRHHLNLSPSAVQLSITGVQEQPNEVNEADR